MDDSFEEDNMEKEVAFFAKNFRKFLKMKKVGSHSAKESFHPTRVIERSLRRKMGRSFNPLKELFVANAMAMGMTIASVDWFKQLGWWTWFKDKEIEELEDEDVWQNEGGINLQEAYDSLLEDCGKYTKVANLAVKKVEEEHRCILVQHREAKCEVERLKGELVEAYSKIKFLELEIIQANVKVKHISTKKLDNVLSSQ